MSSVVRPLFVASWAFAGLSGVGAQDSPYPEVRQPPPTHPVYKCGANTYTHVPCTGGQQIDRPRVTRTFEPPASQDRARQMARAQLPPQTRQQCASLEQAIRAEEARLRAKPAPTEAEEGDLAIQRVRYREMRC